MPLLQWNAYDFIGLFEVEPTVGEEQISYTFKVCRNNVVLRLMVWQYESVVDISLSLESGENVLIELALFVREGAVVKQEGGNEWLELRDCIIAGSRFSYINIGDVFNRRRYPYGHHVRIRVQPQIQVEVVRT